MGDISALGFRSTFYAFLVAGIILAIFFVGFFLGTNRFEETATQPSKIPDISFAEGKQVTTNIVAIDDANKGVNAKLTTRLREGSGLVLVNINNVLADVNTQYGARVAVQVAKEYSNLNMDGLDVIFNIIDTNATMVGGQSAASSMSLAVLSLLLEEEINQSVRITGSLLENGTIGDASGIYPKAKAVQENEGTLFLVPKGSGSTVSNHKKVRRCGTYKEEELCETIFEENVVNIGEDLGIQVIEVENIKEATQYYFVK